MTVAIKSRYPLEVCPDCEREHMGSRCGMTFAERMRSVRLGTDWMPAKKRDREIGKDKGGKDYYDDEALKPLFGGMSAAERKEELMEETQGVGFADAEDIRKHPELVNAHYLEDPADDHHE